MAEPTRDFLRRTFDASAELYDSARPDYPPALFDAMIEATGVQPVATGLR